MTNINTYEYIWLKKKRKKSEFKIKNYRNLKIHLKILLRCSGELQILMLPNALQKIKEQNSEI